MAKYKVLKEFYSTSKQEFVKPGDIIEINLSYDEIVSKYGSKMVEEVKRGPKKKEE